MCTWLWDHLPEHEKPDNENTLKRGGCSLPQKLSTTNNTSESLEITFCVARILLSLILLMSWSGDHSWFWAHGCSHVLSRRHCTVPYLCSGSYILIFFLVLRWWPSPEHYWRVSVLIKIPHLVLYLSTFGSFESMFPVTTIIVIVPRCTIGSRFFPLTCALVPSRQILIFPAGCQSNSCLFGNEQLSQWLNFFHGKSLVQIHHATLFRISLFQTLCQYQFQHTVFQKFRNLSTHITNQSISLRSHSLEHSMIKVLLLLTEAWYVISFSLFDYVT